MERRRHEAEISPTERTIPNDPDKTLIAPRFDEKSVQYARPAVPLTWRGKARTSLPVILLCVAAGVLGGLVVVFALAPWLKNNGPRAETPHAQEQQQSGGTTNPAAPSETPTAGATTTQATPQEEKAGAQAQQGNAQTSAAQTVGTQPSVSGGARAPESAVPANDAAGASQTQPKQGGDVAVGEKVADAGTRDELRSALGDWVAATNARDIDRQMQFYAPNVEAFYLARNASRGLVRAEKARAFASADPVSVQTSEPDIRMGRDGQSAVMRFRKRYRIGERAGEVLQELRWRRTPSGWKIVGERDLRVLQ
jgi:ketosteroid isomerase-like protein